MGVQIHSAEAHLQERDWRQAIARGLKGRCPHCGKGRLFRAFLKPVDTCEVCGEDLHHQRADDLPPYIVITIVGHVIVGGLLLAEKFSDWPMWLHMLQSGLQPQISTTKLRSSLPPSGVWTTSGWNIVV